MNVVKHSSPQQPASLSRPHQMTRHVRCCTTCLLPFCFHASLFGASTLLHISNVVGALSVHFALTCYTISSIDALSLTRPCFHMQLWEISPFYPLRATSTPTAVARHSGENTTIICSAIKLKLVSKQISFNYRITERGTALLSLTDRLSNAQKYIYGYILKI